MSDIELGMNLEKRLMNIEEKINNIVGILIESKIIKTEQNEKTRTNTGTAV